MKHPRVRAIYRATTVRGYHAPYNSLSMKLYYPCQYGDSFAERDSGFIPADSARAPFPVVIIMPGINVSHEAYSWLARRITEAGFAVITYSWISREVAGQVSISPGIKMKRLTAQRYGRKPSCPAIAAVLKELKRVQRDSVLAGLLDLSRIVLGGHSAGGTLALLNANADWFPGLRGAFSYAAHSAANTQLGWAENSIMPLNNDVPLLIMGGTRDGVIAASAHRYGGNGEGEDGGGGGGGGGGKGGAHSPTGPLERTFHEGVSGKRNDRYLLIVEGANHFSLVWPLDNSTGRPFLDGKSDGSNKEIRRYLAQVITNFCDYACNGDVMTGAELQALCNTSHPLAALAAQK